MSNIGHQRMRFSAVAAVLMVLVVKLLVVASLRGNEHVSVNGCSNRKRDFAWQSAVLVCDEWGFL